MVSYAMRRPCADWRRPDFAGWAVRPPARFASDLPWLGSGPSSDVPSIRRSDPWWPAVVVPPCFRQGRSWNSRGTAWTLPATVWARAGSAHAPRASRRYAAMLPTQRVPTAARHVHARYIGARSWRGWDAARCAERRVGTPHAGRSSALALRSASTLPYAAQRNAAQARPYAVQRNAEPAPQNVERALRSAGPPLRDAARRVRPVDRAAQSLRRSSWLRQTESLSPRLDRDDA